MQPKELKTADLDTQMDISLYLDNPGDESKLDIRRNTLFVCEYPTHWVVWEVQESSLHLEGMVPIRTGGTMSVIAEHFWTYRSTTDYLNNWVQTAEDLGEELHIIFI